MERIEAINKAGEAYLIAESELASVRMMGGVGRKVRDAKRAAEVARDNLVEVFKGSGYTLEELAEMRAPDGGMILTYGILDVLEREI